MIMTLTHAYALGALAPGTYTFAVKVYGSVVKRQQFTIGAASPGTPRLVTEENTERAIALESVTMLRAPFSLGATRPFSSDAATRIMLFATGVELQQGESRSTVAAQAEDSQQRTYPLTIEYIGKVPDHDWLTQVIVKIPVEVANAGDVWVSINVGNLASNKVLVSIKPNN